MKLFAVNQALRPAVLGQELAAAGIVVVTIRGIHLDECDPVALRGEVATNDDADDVTVQAVIAAHKPTPQ